MDIMNWIIPIIVISVCSFIAYRIGKASCPTKVDVLDFTHAVALLTGKYMNNQFSKEAYDELLLGLVNEFLTNFGKCGEIKNEWW